VLNILLEAASVDTAEVNEEDDDDVDGLLFVSSPLPAFFGSSREAIAGATTPIADFGADDGALLEGPASAELKLG
jgi:hypothetical protein